MGARTQARNTTVEAEPEIVVAGMGAILEAKVGQRWGTLATPATAAGLKEQAVWAGEIADLGG